MSPDDMAPIRELLAQTGDSIDWNAVTEAQLELIRRIGPTCKGSSECLALIVIGLTTLHSSQRLNAGHMVVLCATIAKRILSEPDGVQKGREFMNELAKGPGHGN